jgi:transcriptional repressor NrdR
MVCPYCSHESSVTNSRLQKRANSVWRRRKCLNCGAIWTSVERLEASTVWRVQHNGHLLSFSYETLYISLYEALKHKKTAVTEAKHLCDTVMQKLASKRTAVLSTELIVQTTYNILRRYDKLAAALYKTTHS